MSEFSLRKAIDIPAGLSKSNIAVLASGGLQSAVLLAYLSEEFESIYPVYVRLGLAHERAEEQQLRRFLAAIRGARLARLTILEKTMEAASNDRQQILLRAANWCLENGITTLAIATLEPHQTADVQGVANGSLTVISPFATISRASILELGRDLPLEFTFSCSRPIVKALGAKHCGKCSKCQMRKLGLAAIHLSDRTQYASADKTPLSV